MARNYKQKLLRLLGNTRSQLQLWDRTCDRAVAQLSSIANLAEQMEALQRCQGERLGVLSHHPQVVPLLQAKITRSMEDALHCVDKEKQVLIDIVQQLMRYTKESQAVFEDIVGMEGLEATCQRSATTFSVGDYPSWIRQLHCAYSYDFEEKLSALQSVQYTSECMGHVCGVWEREVAGRREIMDSLNYTLAVHDGRSGKE